MASYEPYLASIDNLGFTWAIRNWALCDGSFLSISQNTALFSLLGTTYGGDGQRTFALPDLRGRVVIGQGMGPGLPPYDIGEEAGTESTTLTLGNLPAHEHPVSLNGTGSGIIANTTSAVGQTGTAAPAVTGVAGANLPFSNMQPYLTLAPQIALYGVYPSRN